jgi:hypothetical protein
MWWLAGPGRLGPAVGRQLTGVGLSAVTVGLDWMASAAAVVVVRSVTFLELGRLVAARVLPGWVSPM